MPHVLYHKHAVIRCYHQFIVPCGPREEAPAEPSNLAPLGYVRVSGCRKPGLGPFLETTSYDKSARLGITCAKASGILPQLEQRLSAFTHRDVTTCSQPRQCCRARPSGSKSAVFFGAFSPIHNTPGKLVKLRISESSGSSPREITIDKIRYPGTCVPTVRLRVHFPQASTTQARPGRHASLGRI